MKLLSRLSYFFLGLLFIFLSNNAIAGTCDNCAACNNDIKIVDAPIKVQKVISNYQCFKSGDKYVLNFVVQANFDAPSQPIVIKPNEGHVLEINNLNLAEAEGVDKDLFLIISGSNVSINNSILTGGGIEITSSNVSITGGTVGAITIASSASDVVISGVDIASNAAVGIDVAGQEVTITSPDFIGDIVAPILLAEGANAGVKSIDTSKVWKKMSGDGNLVNEIVGEVDSAGSVELFLHEGDGQNKKISYLKNCSVDKKENTKYPSSDVISDGAWVFIYPDLSEPLNKQISFTFTDSNGNTSAMSSYTKLADIDDFPSTIPIPATELPTPIGVVSEGETTGVEGWDTAVGDGGEDVATTGGLGMDAKAGVGCSLVTGRLQEESFKSGISVFLGIIGILAGLMPLRRILCRS